MSDRLATPIPKLMRTLAKDHRGYPIPWIVLLDKSGRPQFTINDTRRTEQCRKKRLCSICGKRLDLAWFIGGSRCFVHPRGAFIDPPVHFECGTYALQVCPFLAMPKYSGRIDEKLLKPKNVPEGMAIARADYMPPNQPERFGFGCSSDYNVVQPSPGELLYIVSQWEYVEWWRDGKQTNAPSEIPLDTAWVRH